MRPALVVRRAGHGELSWRLARGGRPLEAKSVELEGEAGGPDRAPAFVDAEVQVRRRGVSAVAEQAELLSGADVLAGLDADRARLQVAIEGEHIASYLDHDVVSPVVE